eukprot:CAMPEP_0180290976 /NCGR_PEP_ID=MMETSP0988-20121125/15801_1 /TAXON_ID=697907 /ORGANISM="non described non described, Strain CCMP2293" /LENGTH=151 /DNA_ID=CAMNT_0022266621 /DNA_START=218 /DNA_END=673 /DNA_ORIENTATION=+
MLQHLTRAVKDAGVETPVFLVLTSLPSFSARRPHGGRRGGAALPPRKRGEKNGAETRRCLRDSRERLSQEERPRAPMGVAPDEGGRLHPGIVGAHILGWAAPMLEGLPQEEGPRMPHGVALSERRRLRRGGHILILIRCLSPHVATLYPGF